MSKANHFLPSLFRMCNTDTPEHRECITWSEDGGSFWVSNIERFSRDILPLYFKHNNYASFVRQLNMYGFHRSTEPKTKVEPGVMMIEHFTHPYFLRGRKELLTHIHRKTSSASGSVQRKAKRESASDTVGSGGTSAKEVQYLQGQLHEAGEVTKALGADVELLKQNQMQLANTIQILHSQNMRLSNSVEESRKTVGDLVKLLQQHNISGSEALVVPASGVLDRRQESEAPGAAGWSGEATGAGRTEEMVGSEVFQVDDSQPQEIHSMDLDSLLFEIDGSGGAQGLQQLMY